MISIEELGNIGEFLAAIATLATLVYLAIQIRQNTKSVQSSSVESVMSHVQENIALIGSTKESADVFSRGIADFNSLSESDRTQFSLMITAIFSGLDTMYWSYCNGNLDPVLWRRESNVLRMYLGSDGGRAVFDFNDDAGIFTEIFSQYVKSELISGTSDT